MYQQKSGNKYHAQSSEYNGIRYDSKLEAAYAAELDIRKRGKDIKNWERQTTLELKVNGLKICNYKIDFIIEHNDGSFEWAEIKGFETMEWRMKWKLLEATFDDHKRTPDDRLTVIKQSQVRYRW